MTQDRYFSIHDVVPQKATKEGNVYLSLTKPIELFDRHDLNNPVSTRIIRIGINMDMRHVDKSEYAFQQIKKLTRYYYSNISAYAIMGNYADIDPNASILSWIPNDEKLISRHSSYYSLVSKETFLFNCKNSMEIIGKYFAGCTIVTSQAKTIVERAMAMKISFLCDNYNKNHIDKIILGGCHKAILKNNEYQWVCEWFNNRQIDTIEKFLDYVRKYTVTITDNPMMQVYA